MSRTKHHKNQKHRHCGEDLWSKRAGMGNYPYSAYSKWLTRRKERAESKRIVFNMTKLVKSENEWRPYDFLKGIDGLSIFDAVEFLAGEDAPNGSFKKGDIIKTNSLLMNTSFFSHWRPVLD